MAMDDATPVSTRLRRSTPTHDAYTVRVANRRVASLVTARPADARRWISTTRWRHHHLVRSHRLVVGLGVQWTPLHLHGHVHHRGHTPPPATLQLCAGHRCLVFHLAQVPHDGAARIPAALSRFLADPRVTFVGSGSAHDRRMLLDHYGIRVASGCELRAVAGMGNASVEHMAAQFLGYPGIRKPKRVAVSAWHTHRLSVEQVEYACVDAYLALRLGILLCPRGGHGPLPQQRPPVLRRAPPPTAVALTAMAVDAAESSTKIAETRPAGFTGSDMDTDTEYASDDDADFSSDEFEPVGYGAVY